MASTGAREPIRGSGAVPPVVPGAKPPEAEAIW